MLAILAVLGFLFLTGLIQWLIIQKLWDDRDPARLEVQPSQEEQSPVQQHQENSTCQPRRMCLFRISRDESF